MVTLGKSIQSNTSYTVLKFYGQNIIITVKGIIHDSCYSIGNIRVCNFQRNYNGGNLAVSFVITYDSSSVVSI
ncbi:hypothetical protein Barb6_03118 [Bacteroidales bacterium Barb6]|nr:hypothetical protein Barb6_03118 [Bacteroidales bacterium Barb6]